MNENELKEIIDKHILWLNGKGGTRATLAGANLKWSDLTGANLKWATLAGATLAGAKGLYAPLACPDTGAFIGWKKVENGLIVKLQIPEDAKRNSATGRKCRCDKAKVISIENADGTKAKQDKAVSHYDNAFVYTVGQTVTVSDFCENRWEECAAGIHFFITREEAVNY